jgi:hypothetical protein
MIVLNGNLLTCRWLRARTIRKDQRSNTLCSTRNVEINLQS